MTTSAYVALEQRFLRLAHLAHAETFLSWDQQVMMPPGGAQGRAEALAELHRTSHEWLTAAEMAEWIERAAGEALSLEQRANLREMRRRWRQATCLPADLVQARSLAASRCEHAWRGQRQDNDWAGFLPNFQTVVALAREEAQARLAVSDGDFTTPYDAMLELYAPGDSSAFIDSVFNDLRARLPALIQEITERQRGEVVADLGGHYDLATQQSLSRRLMEILGFDFRSGRLDVSTHPFSTGVPGDHRITTRYRETDFLDALQGTAHETGHASYETGLPKAWNRQPVGQARSMSIHESQSLLFEKQLFLAEPFVAFLAPLLHEHFPSLRQHDARHLWKAMTRVKPGLIRVAADEVTYPMHVILRHEIESALINGSLEARDVPELWDTRMQEYLGLSTAGDYRNGCMQDIHWPSGAFGYFPSYTLGALNAAQICAALRDTLPELDELLTAGEFGPIRGWLGEKIWSQGSFLDAQELMLRATGSATHAEPFIRHLRSRYLGC